MYCCVGKQYKSGLEILFEIPHTFSSSLSFVTSRHVRRLGHGKKPSLQNKSVRGRVNRFDGFVQAVAKKHVLLYNISKTAFDTDDDNTDKTKVRLLLIRTFRDCKLDGRTAQEPGSWENFPGL